MVGPDAVCVSADSQLASWFMTDMPRNGTRIILITGNERRHRYVAAQLGDRLGLAAIISEAKAPTAAAVIADLTDPMVRQWLNGMRSRRNCWAMQDFPDDVEILSLPTGAANDIMTFDWVRVRQPDAILLYGSTSSEHRCSISLTAGSSTCIWDCRRIIAALALISGHWSTIAPKELAPLSTWQP